MSIIILFFILPIITAAIAKSKGRSFFGFYVYGFLFFPIALVHALIMVSIKPTVDLSAPAPITAAPVAPVAPVILRHVAKAGRALQCPDCGTLTGEHSMACPKCHYSFITGKSHTPTIEMLNV